MTFKSYEMWTAVRAVAVFSLFGLASADPVANSTNSTLPKANLTSTIQNGDQIPKLPYFAGVTLSGMDFEARPINKTTQVPGEELSPESFTIPSYDQAMHYLDDRHLNLVKLPIAWESLESFPFTDKLNRSRLEIYTDVVATMTSQNAAVILTLSSSIERFANLSRGQYNTFHKRVNHTADSSQNERVHHNASLRHTNGTNYTSDVSSAAFVNIWGKLAHHFKNDRRVIFHLMEIPHGSIPPRFMNETIQAAVTKIRSQGARNVIILPSFAPPANSTTFNTFRDFPRDFASMKGVKNPDGTTAGIVFDLSLTLGPKRNTSDRCGGVNATAIVKPVVELLRKHHRQAIVGTLAAGSEDSCTRSLARFGKAISSSYPHLAGFVLYGAGAYPENLPWSLTKEGKFDEEHCSEAWVDQPNFNSVAPFFLKKKGAAQSTTQL